MADKYRAVPKILADGYKVGDIIKVQAIVIHAMDTGFQTDKESGALKKRYFLKQLKVSFDGHPVASFDYEVSASQNPKIIFPFKVTKAGTMTLDFVDNIGDAVSKTIAIQPQ